jgi:putative two-component system response regulator
MPFMDGWEAFNRIRAICALRDVPIIFLTSLEGAVEEQRALAMGAADYITKPFDVKALMGRVKNAIEKNGK